MIKVIGVRFRTAGKVYFFDPGELEIKKGQNVIVETARGTEYGYVVMGERMVEDQKVIQPLKPVLRLATEEDDAIQAKNRQKEKLPSSKRSAKVGFSRRTKARAKAFIIAATGSMR